MLTERLQILVSRAQRRRLELEAKRRGTSVGAFIREAVDARARGVPPAERRRAVAGIRAMSGGRYLGAETLERIVDEEREQPLPGSVRRPRR